MNELTITYLDESLLDGVPPCTVLTPVSQGARPCGKPAVAQVRVTCSLCRTSGWDFMCAGCLWMLKNGYINFSKCQHPITDWKYL